MNAIADARAGAFYYPAFYADGRLDRRSLEK
jgi:hypothetical protein